MATDQNSSHYTDADPAAPESDALSLHTIAEQADAYAAQEQADADFALALALEEEESRDYPSSQRQPVAAPREAQNLDEENTEPFPPYRDDPDAVDTSVPYRDDVNAAPIDSEQQNEAESASKSSRWRRCFNVSKKLARIWFCCACTSVLFTVVVVTAVIIATLVYGKKVDTKELAFRASGSQDYDLKLPALYPALEAGASERCQKTWKKYAATLRCHRVVLSPVWDDGDVDAVRKADADPFMYSEAVCTKQCWNSITNLRNPMSNECFQRTDRFDFFNYAKNQSKYFREDELEEGPIHLAKALQDRYDRLCAKPEKMRGNIQWGTCAADLWMRWGIVDGKNEATLNGLEEFLKQTDEKKTVEGGMRTGTVLNEWGNKKEYAINVPARRVGPGVGETECGYCTLNWLERKMRSFEFGQILDPRTGSILGLGEFNTRMHHAIQRCGAYESGRILRDVHKKWTEFGWWCGDQPCHPDGYSSTLDVARRILHGLNESDWPLKTLPKLIAENQSPVKALTALQNGLRSLPCSIWINQIDMTDHAAGASNHLMAHLCSDPCRNAADRIQQQHGEEFAEAAKDVKYGLVFHGWKQHLDVINATCLSDLPGLVVRQSASFCAPGYFALGHPQWLYYTTPHFKPSRKAILYTFSAGIDKLDRSLPRYPQKPGQDDESQRIAQRKSAESVCNPCAGQLLIGRNPDWRDRVNEFLEDDSIDGREYVAVAKKYILTCWKMHGHAPNEQQLKRVWGMTGLDQYD